MFTFQRSDNIWEQRFLFLSQEGRKAACTSHKLPGSASELLSCGANKTPRTRRAHRALLTGRELLLVLLSNAPFLIQKPVCFQDKISTDIKNLSKMTSKDYKIYSQRISAKGVCAF